MEYVLLANHDKSVQLLTSIDAANIFIIDWNELDKLFRMVPLLTRICPNGQADINQLQDAGMPVCKSSLDNPQHRISAFSQSIVVLGPVETLVILLFDLMAAALIMFVAYDEKLAAIVALKITLYERLECWETVLFNIPCFK